MLRQVTEAAGYYANSPSGIGIDTDQLKATAVNYGLPILGIGLAAGAVAAMPRAAKKATGRFAWNRTTGILEGSFKRARASFGDMFLQAKGPTDLLKNHSLPLSASAAGLGAILGAHFDKDNPGTGALIGAGIGVGAVQAAKYARVGRAIWKGGGPIGKLAIVGLLSAGIMGGSILMNNRNADIPEDQAIPVPGGYTGIKRRLDMIGATGDLTFGLHNNR